MQVAVHVRTRPPCRLADTGFHAIADAAGCGPQISQALEDLHPGIIHRDIKPANVMLVEGSKEVRRQGRRAPSTEPN